MSWDASVPISGTRIVDIPTVHGANWTAISDTWGLEHQVWSVVASGRHKPGISGLVGSIASSALPLTAEEGCVVLDDASSGVGWVYSGGKWQMPSSGFATVRVHVYRGTNQTISAGTTATVGFSTSGVDSMASFNTTTFTFTSPADGYYLVNPVISLTPDVANKAVYLQVQHLDSLGTIRYTVTESKGTLSTDEFSMEVSPVLYLSAGDLIKITFYHNSTSMAIQGGAERTFLDIYRMS
jgi:hypothetical protein